MSKPIKAIGLILAFIGIVLIGFFDYSNAWLGSIDVPLIGIFGLTGPWWNTKIWALLMGAFGVLLLRYG